MKISITYIDGTIESFNDVDDYETGDDFFDMMDEDGELKVSVSVNQIRKIQYD